MEQTSFFIVNRLQRGISKTVHDTDIIPIGLSIIHHETFEIGVCIQTLAGCA
jgi:hypothetical protein